MKGQNELRLCGAEMAAAMQDYVNALMKHPPTVTNVK
jgi:hypothetical protein